MLALPATQQHTIIEQTASWVPDFTALNYESARKYEEYRPDSEHNFRAGGEDAFAVRYDRENPMRLCMAGRFVRRGRNVLPDSHYAAINHLAWPKQGYTQSEGANLMRWYTKCRDFVSHWAKKRE